MDELRDRIAANLAAHERHVVEAAPGQRLAAVALLVSPVDGVLTYAITRRALTLRRGAGNFALPGGNLDPGEDAIDAALRETWEELGVQLTRDDCLGLLDDFTTLGGHRVTPVVLWASQALVLNPNPDEVHLAWLHQRPLLPLAGCGGWSDELQANPPDERGNSRILPWRSIAELEAHLRELKLV